MSLSASADPAVGQASARAVPDGARLQSSRLLPSLFSSIKARRVRLFEAGPIAPETISFLSQVRSRIHVCDLFSEQLVRTLQSELSEQEMKRGFQELLGFKVGTMIDVCLFWDFLNYLNRPALRAFSAALRPYIHPGTRAHGFTVLNVETPLRNQQYGVVDHETISVRPAKAPQLDYYPHSHEELNKSLGCFEVGRGWLLPDGRLEILLNAVV